MPFLPLLIPASNTMSEVLQARVQWQRFGYHVPGMFGDRFDDAGDRLAIVTCPWCANPRTAEYTEYMHMLRYDAITCAACKGAFTLRWNTNTNDPHDETTPKDDHPAAESPGERDMFGRRDLGTA